MQAEWKIKGIYKADAQKVADEIKSLRAQEATAKAKLEKSRKGAHPYKLRVACGYAVYDPGKDDNLEATRERSDMMMYKNKEEIKEKEKNA